MPRKRTLGKGSRVAATTTRVSPGGSSPKPPRASSDESLRSLAKAESLHDDSSRLSRLRRLQSQQSAAVDRTSRSVGAARAGRSRTR